MCGGLHAAGQGMDMRRMRVDSRASDLPVAMAAACRWQLAAESLAHMWVVLKLLPIEATNCIDSVASLQEISSSITSLIPRRSVLQRLGGVVCVR